MSDLLKILRLYFDSGDQEPELYAMCGVATYTAATVNLGLNSGEVSLIDTTSNAVTVNLPAAKDSVNYKFTVKLVVKGGANAVTVKAPSGNIDGTAGGTGIVISTLYAKSTFKSDGINYWQI